MTLTPRTNATTASTDSEAGTDPFERVTEDGTTYLVAPVVAQREDVYAYRINGDVQREYLPGEELTAPLDAWDGTPLVLRHPDAPPDAQPLLSESGVEGAVVGEFREATRTNGDERLAGKVAIREDAVGEYDGDLRGYVERVRRTGVGEVSTGYDVGRLEHSPGRHNGTEYTHVQREIRPDHLALLPDQVGNCPVDGGVCGVGRANKHARTNHRPAEPPPTAGDDESGPTAFAQLGRRVAELFGLGEGDVLAGADGPDRSNATRWAEPHVESGAGADADDSQTTMTDDDSEKIDTLVSGHGFSRENLEPLEGSECLGRIHEQFVDAEDDGADQPSTETPETPATPDGGADTEGSAETAETDGGADPLADVDLDALISERVDERLEAAFDEQAGDLADRVDEARQNEQHIQTVAESDDYPLDREALEGMGPEAVAKLAESVDTSEEAPRANYAGLASGPSFEAGDVSPDDGLDDIPAPGTVPDSGGDD